MADNNVVDELSLKIVSEADKAVDGLDKMISGLSRLGSALSSVNASGMKSFSSSVKNLNKAASDLSQIDTLKMMSTINTVKLLGKEMSNISVPAESLNSISRLASTLSKVSNVQTSGNLTSITNEMKSFVSEMNTLNGVTFDTTNLSNLVNAISKLGGVKVGSATTNLPALTQNLNNLVTSLNKVGTVNFDISGLTSFASAISKLGGVNVERAITNLPKLATALNDVMTTLSKAPVVNTNIINMTNALASLASQGQRVSSASKSIVSGLNRTSSSMSNTNKKALSLAKAFGTIYANFWLVIRGIKSLWKAIDSQSDYIESYNYYNVITDKIAQENFEAAGYDSAEEYAEGFQSGLEELFGKMSGQALDTDSGLLISTNMKSLGVDINQLTQYASNIMAVGNSMNLTGEATTATAKAMTMLAGDMSSLKNISLEDTMSNLQSGLLGQSRALYKYGIDITNATLQQKAYELGITKSVSAMTQGEKAQLRMIAILEQSKVAWGDLANSIQSPSNQIRLLQTNITNLGRTIGSFFMPILGKLLPFVNGLVIAIQRLFSWLANLMGIEIDLSDYSQGYSDLTDDLEDTTDALEDVADAQEDVFDGFKGTRKWDERNNLTSSDTSNVEDVTDALSDTIDLTDELTSALADYESVWNEAFDNMANKAEEWADRISKQFETVKKFFTDLFNGDYAAAGKDFSDIISGIFDSIAGGIDSVDWNGIGVKIGEFLTGVDWTEILKSVGKAIWAALKASFKLYAGMWDSAPLETAIITSISLLSFTGVGKALITKIGAALTAEGATLGTTLGASILTAFAGYEVGKNVIRELEIGDKTIGEWVDDSALAKGIAQVILNIEEMGGPINAVKQGISDTFTGLSNSLEELNQNIADDVNGTADSITNGWENLKSGKVWEDVTSATQTAFENLWSKLTSGLEEFKTNWLDGFDIIKTTGTEKLEAFEVNWQDGVNIIYNAWTSFVGNIQSKFTSGIDSIRSALQSFAEWAQGVISSILNTFSSVKSSISSGISSGLSNIGSLFSGSKVKGYALGGYPDKSSLFYAGENGVPELMGTIGGKTAVAGGAEITGISDSIYTTASQQISVMREQNQLLKQILNKTGITTKQIFNAVRDENQSYINRTGVSAI
jgi:hypothetical protein